ncbi:MAG: TetR/AcrR family transcriptional regulator [Pseudomonadota bacterium]
MSFEDRKSETRDKIERAAERIIRSEGASGLTMRRLADEAQVALRSPYNLYGSKTGLLIALLDRVNAALFQDLGSGDQEWVLIEMIQTLDQTQKFYEVDEEYHRGIFWEIMISDHPEAREDGHSNIVRIVTEFALRAKEAGELRDHVDPIVLGEQLGLSLLSTMGSWAGGNLTMAQTIAHTKLVWISILQLAAESEPAAALTKHLGSFASQEGSAKP